MTGTANMLRRYRSLPALLHTLQSWTVTLLTPETWEDRNEAYFMRQYQQRSKAKAVHALCFSMAPERYHLWRVFTAGTDGVCVEFYRERLVKRLAAIKGMMMGEVTYKLIDDVSKLRPGLEELPFLKRVPFGDENGSFASSMSTTMKNAKRGNSRSISHVSVNPP